MKKDIILYESEILKAINKIEKYVGKMSFDEFCDDEKTFDACCMMLQHIGECGVKLLNLTGGNYKNIPFIDMRGFRNKITHDYMGVDEKIIWETIKESIPELKILLQ
ncbi:MAG: HepT-like ribonuclease domain-containing protein [Candidatus Gracilibacteria bacterium]